jgi:hypothetical protein
LLLATGEREQAEFHRQQHAYAAAWRAWGGDVREIDAPGDDHFSILLALADRSTPLAGALSGLIGGP